MSFAEPDVSFICRVNVHLLFLSDAVDAAVAAFQGMIAGRRFLPSFQVFQFAIFSFLMI